MRVFLFVLAVVIGNAVICDVPIDVSDGHGHGPDADTGEYRRVESRKRAKYHSDFTLIVTAIAVGLRVLPCYMSRKTVAVQQGPVEDKTKDGSS